MQFINTIAIYEVQDEEQKTLKYDAIPANIQPVKRNSRFLDASFIKDVQYTDYVIYIPTGYNVEVGDEVAFVDDMKKPKTATISGYDVISFRHFSPYVELTCTI